MSTRPSPACERLRAVPRSAPTTITMRRATWPMSLSSSTKTRATTPGSGSAAPARPGPRWRSSNDRGPQYTPRMRLALLLLVSLLARADSSVQPNLRAPKQCIGKGAWTPSASQVAALETKLRPFLDKQRNKGHGPTQLDDYLRNYTGSTAGDRKLISVYAWRPWKPDEDPCDPPGIKDGGCGVWRV